MLGKVCAQKEQGCAGIAAQGAVGSPCMVVFSEMRH